MTRLGQREVGGSSFTGLLVTALCAVASGLTSKKYYHVDEILTWHDAQQYCREHYTDLAFISNQEEADLVFNIKETAQVMWIGLYRDNNDPIGWKWSGGEDSEFRLWGKKEPNKGKSETCANVLDNVWIDTSCDNEHTFKIQYTLLMLAIYEAGNATLEFT
uniref:C-type lectin domain-containing protein n=1 Tax=Hucho hucho TaxID=62062 RepID=A0A4W5M7P6_9TELE